MARPGFQLLEQTDDLEPPQPAIPPPVKSEPAVAAVMLALRALSQRALVAVGSLFTLVTIASAWWLWASTPNPTPLQVASLSIYAVFILVANWIVRR